MHVVCCMIVFLGFHQTMCKKKKGFSLLCIKCLRRQLYLSIDAFGFCFPLCQAVNSETSLLTSGQISETSFIKEIAATADPGDSEEWGREGRPQPCSCIITDCVFPRLSGETTRLVEDFTFLFLHNPHPAFPSTAAPRYPPALPPPPHTPNIFNYIFSQVVRLSNQGADIDACADKSANTGNKINKDFEERVTANFAQCSAPHSRVMFLIEQATPENSGSAPGWRDANTEA